jgi:hypothetical protein
VANKVAEDPDNAEQCEKKRGCCSHKACDDINLELQFYNPNKLQCDANGNLKAGGEGRRYVTNLEDFKGEQYIYPALLPLR